MNIDYGPAPVDSLSDKNRTGGKAPTGKPHSSQFKHVRPGLVEPPKIEKVVSADITGLPFKEIDDGIKHRHSFLGGCPKPLRIIKR